MNLLISGVSRSGTSLLTSLVGHHPDCIAMMEHQYCEENKIVSPHKVTANKLTTPRQIQFEHPRLPFLLRRYLGLILRKTSHNILDRIGILIDEYPDSPMSFKEYVRRREARLLFIVRDPDHVVDSLIKRGSNPEARAAYRWAQGTRELYKAYREFKYTYILEFSQLVKEPDLQLNEIFDYVDLSSDPKISKRFSSSFKYDTKKIDPSVAEKNTRDYRIPERFPKSYNMYMEMKRNSN